MINVSVAIAGETFVKDFASLEKAMVSNLTMVPNIGDIYIYIYIYIYIGNFPFVLLISVCCVFPTIGDIYG
jgi:hypothetical protein